MGVTGFLWAVPCLRRQRGGDALPANGFPTFALLLRYPVCAYSILLRLSVEFGTTRRYPCVRFCSYIAGQCRL
jgi:hypothetical protein